MSIALADRCDAEHICLQRIRMIFLKHLWWNFSIALVSRLFVLHDSLPYKEEGQTIALDTAIFVFLARPFLVLDSLSQTAKRRTGRSDATGYFVVQAAVS